MSGSESPLLGWFFIHKKCRRSQFLVFGHFLKTSRQHRSSPTCRQSSPWSTSGSSSTRCCSSSCTSRPRPSRGPTSSSRTARTRRRPPGPGPPRRRRPSSSGVWTARGRSWSASTSRQGYITMLPPKNSHMEVHTIQIQYTFCWPSFGLKIDLPTRAT